MTPALHPYHMIDTMSGGEYQGLLAAADDSTSLTDYVVSELARIWNITGVYPQATAQLG